uniref:Sodium/hydrogen exchanger n=1 Tax=Ornithorhynchus anatinus TaxID=9258 RepID=A0A6I8NDA5_ORNAN
KGGRERQKKKKRETEKRDREREGERKRDRERQTEGERGKTEREIERERETQRETPRQTVGHREGERKREKRDGGGGLGPGVRVGTGGRGRPAVLGRRAERVRAGAAALLGGLPTRAPALRDRPLDRPRLAGQDRVPPLQPAARRGARELPADRGGAGDRGHHLRAERQVTPGHGQRHLLPLPPAAHRAGRGLLPAQPAVLREPGGHPAVRGGRHLVERAGRGPVPARRLPRARLRPARRPAAPQPVVRQPDRRRGPRGRPVRLRGDPRQREAARPRVRGVPAQRRRHRGAVQALQVLQREAVHPRGGRGGRGRPVPPGGNRRGSGGPAVRGDGRLHHALHGAHPGHRAALRLPVQLPLLPHRRDVPSLRDRGAGVTISSTSGSCPVLPERTQYGIGAPRTAAVLSVPQDCSCRRDRSHGGRRLPPCDPSQGRSALGLRPCFASRGEGIIACATSMKSYVEANISQKSHTTVKYFLKMWSSVSETLIFIFLGVSTVGDNHEWSWPYIGFTVLFCLIWRALGVLVLTFFVNKFHVNTVTPKDQFIIAYGGLRGAICFSLVFLLPNFRHKKLFIAATTVVILFTVFVQGMTIRPLVDLLDVTRRRDTSPTVSEQIHMRFLDHLLAGIEDISGHWGQYYWKDKLESFDSRYLQRVLLRDWGQPRSSIVLLYEKLERKHAIELAESGQLLHSSPGASLSAQEAPAAPPAVAPNPALMANVHKILATSLYKIRRMEPTYNRYTLPGETGAAQQATEILIRRHKSLRPSISHSDSDHFQSENDPRWTPHAASVRQGQRCQSLTVGDPRATLSLQCGRSKSTCLALLPLPPSRVQWVSEDDDDDKRL